MAIRGRDYKGEGERALHCSAKTVIASSAADASALRCDVRRGVRGVVHGLPARLRAEVTEEMVNEAVRAGELQDGDREGGVSKPVHGEPTRADVQALRTKFEGFVISEIDKERGELAVL